VFIEKSVYSGSGFYINLPGAQKDVILTAGHNLVGLDGELSTDLVVLHNDGTSVEVDNSQFKINNRYFTHPQESNAAYDYGAILIPREKDRPPRPGFGFSLMLGIDAKNRATEDPKDNYLTKNVSVSGYREESPPEKPDWSTGDCTIHPNQLEYNVATQAGLSGSPVWTAYNGVETVVAIQYVGFSTKCLDLRGDTP
jgi:V8-like Glu-specific endopeptidase